MSIQIQQPELEAMIQERLDSGAFRSVEDVLMQALKSLPELVTPSQAGKPNLADFLMTSPLSGSELVIERNLSLPRPIDL